VATRNNLVGTPLLLGYQGVRDRLLGFYGKDCEWLDVLALSTTFSDMLAVASPAMRADYAPLVEKMTRSPLPKPSNKPRSRNATPGRRSPASSPDDSGANTPTLRRERRAESRGLRFSKGRPKAQDVVNHPKHKVLFDLQTSDEFKALQRAVLKFDPNWSDTVVAIQEAVKKYKALKYDTVEQIVARVESSNSLPSNLSSIDAATTLYKSIVEHNLTNPKQKIMPAWLNEFASNLKPEDAGGIGRDRKKDLQFAAIMMNTLSILSSPQVTFDKFIDSTGPAFFMEDGPALLCQVIATHNNRSAGTLIERVEVTDKLAEIESKLKDPPKDFDAVRAEQMRMLLSRTASMWQADQLVK